MANIKLKDKYGNANVYSGVNVVEVPNASDFGNTNFIVATDATATTYDIVEGKTAYVADGKITGSIPVKTADDITVSGATVTAPQGYYATMTSKTVDSGSVSAPTASKGTVTNHSIEITPSVTSTTGYINGGKQDGTPVTVSASELVSGSETKTLNGVFDVTNLASVTVNVSASSLVSGTKEITTTTQTDVTDYKYAQINDANLVASNIKNGASVLGITGTFTNSTTVSAGQTAATASEIVSGKSAWVNGEEVKGDMTNNGSVSESLAVNGTYVIPQGYHDGTGVVTQNISAKAEATYNTSASDQVINGSQFLSGDQTIKAVKINNINASNIKSGAQVTVGDENNEGRIANVTGTFTDASTVSSGQVAAISSDILSGKSAWVDGVEVKGAIENKGAQTATISTQGGTYTIPQGYHNGDGVVTASLTPSVLDNTIISGTVYEESAGDYAWKSTVAIPEGYHNAQTLEKTFSEIFPAPETEGTATELRAGYQLFNHEGKKITGTMTEKSGATFTASTTDQVINGGQYLTGDQTIKAVSLNAVAGNMLSGTSASISSNGSTVASVSGTIQTYNSANVEEYYALATSWSQGITYPSSNPVLAKKGSSTTLTFSVQSGYSAPTATVTNATYQIVSVGSNNYNLVITNPTGYIDILLRTQSL